MGSTLVGRRGVGFGGGWWRVKRTDWIDFQVGENDESTRCKLGERYGCTGRPRYLVYLRWSGHGLSGADRPRHRPLTATGDIGKDRGKVRSSDPCNLYKPWLWAPSSGA